MSSNKTSMWEHKTVFNFGKFYLVIRFIARKFMRPYRFLRRNITKN